MPSAFTHYWQREKLDKNGPPILCTRAYSSQFIQRGVSTGDRVFFVSYYGKCPFLVGAITVAAHPVELEEGGELITANAGSGSVMDFERAIPIEIARQIVRSDTGDAWKFVSPEVMDSQTLRGVQRITADSAALLDGLLQATAASYSGDSSPIDLSIDESALYPDEIVADDTYLEGAVTQVLVNRYERDPAARKACLAEYGCVCSVCDLNFSEWYGELGEGFIHVHHITPISLLGDDYRIDPLADMVPVCPNCHAMLHRTNPPLTIKQLQEIYMQHLDQMSNPQEG